MIIRKYGELPMMYAPDKGEVVWARKSYSHPFLRAVVLHAARSRGGLRVKVQWLETGQHGQAAVAGGTGVIMVDPQNPALLIKEISKAGGAEGRDVS